MTRQPVQVTSDAARDLSNSGRSLWMVIVPIALVLVGFAGAYLYYQKQLARELEDDGAEDRRITRHSSESSAKSTTESPVKLTLNERLLQNMRATLPESTGAWSVSQSADVVEYLRLSAEYGKTPPRLEDPHSGDYLKRLLDPQTIASFARAKADSTQVVGMILFFQRMSRLVDKYQELHGNDADVAHEFSQILAVSIRAGDGLGALMADVRTQVRSLPPDKQVTELAALELLPRQFTAMCATLAATLASAEFAKLSADEQALPIDALTTGLPRLGEVAYAHAGKALRESVAQFAANLPAARSSVDRLLKAFDETRFADDPLGDPAEPFDLSAIPIPEFPKLGDPIAGSDSGIDVFEARCVPAARETPPAPGHDMSMLFYLPPGERAPGSLPCVLVPPAGSNMFSGVGLDDLDYGSETVPYAAAGFAVVHFSLDGELDQDSVSAFNLGPARDAFWKFRSALAGLFNARNALEFALQQPQINSQRIYVAGHSSAATLSLLFAAHEPRLAGCIAYAPAIDLVADASIGPDADARQLPGMYRFAIKSSPITHSERIRAPVFLLHARDDETTSSSASESFAKDLKTRGRRVTFVPVDEGGHYDPMIEVGIPAAIKWLASPALQPPTAK